MKQTGNRKRRKTFPLEMEDELHKALKYKAIESDQTLHTYIIETLMARVQEEPAQYVLSSRQTANPGGRKK
jgi:predicted HicB family RNase H-like nuclease